MSEKDKVDQDVLVPEFVESVHQLLPHIQQKDCGHTKFYKLCHWWENGCPQGSCSSGAGIYAAMRFMPGGLLPRVHRELLKWTPPSNR